MRPDDGSRSSCVWRAASCHFELRSSDWIGNLAKRRSTAAYHYISDDHRQPSAPILGIALPASLGLEANGNDLNRDAGDTICSSGFERIARPRCPSSLAQSGCGFRQTLGRCAAFLAAAAYGLAADVADHPGNQARVTRTGTVCSATIGPQWFRDSSPQVPHYVRALRGSAGLDADLAQ